MLIRALHPTWQILHARLQLKSRLDAVAAGPTPATILIVGSGYTGVELALAVKEKLGSRGNVQLVSSGPTVLNTAAPAVQRAAS